MWGIREKVSLLLDHGHPEAWSYPLGLVVQETTIIVDRENQREALRARLIQAAVSATPNGFLDGKSLKKMQDAFGSILKKLGGG